MGKTEDWILDTIIFNFVRYNNGLVAIKENVFMFYKCLSKVTYSTIIKSGKTNMGKISSC